jgi:hypothetical protein
MFRKRDLFPSSDERWDPLERANPSYSSNLSIRRRTKSKTPVILSVTHHCQNPSESVLLPGAAACLWSSDRTPPLHPSQLRDSRSEATHKSRSLFIRVCCRGILQVFTCCIQERVGFLASIIRADKGNCNYNWLCINAVPPLFLFHVKQPSDSATIPPRSSSHRPHLQNFNTFSVYCEVLNV